MSTTIAITRNAPGRFRGFFASCMLEVGPGIYVAPDLKKSVREEIIETLSSWEQFLPPDGSLLVVWEDSSEPSGLEVFTIGLPKKSLVEYQGLWLINRDLTELDEPSELRELLDPMEAPVKSEDQKEGFQHLFDSFTNEYSKNVGE